MFSESAEWYDWIYAQLKDYRSEAAAVSTLIRARKPGASSVLDVGCGTGEHAKYLAHEHGLRVDGLDLEPAFVAIAREKVPAGRFYRGDMADFSLPERYDAVVCLFSAIGYLTDADALQSALRCFRQHLNPGGVVLVEPWFEPDHWRDGHVSHALGEADDLIVSRVSHAGVRGRVSIVTFHYLVATREGIRHRSEVHELGLFTSAEMLAAFQSAGLAAEYDPQGLTGRGLYVARAQAAGDEPGT